MNASSLALLEDRAFGPSPDEDPDGGRVPVGPRTWSECAAAYMFPLTVTAALAAVVSYSLCKGMEYQELFNANPRYRTGLLLLNVLAVLMASSLVAYSIHDQARMGKLQALCG